MDLLATVRKEGSRGGRGDFQWSDVQASSHRENYLGHSLMAPVGRWQKGKDLNWYAKADADAAEGEDPQEQAARLRREEIRRVKEAEEDALARALGLPVPDRTNPNAEQLGGRREASKIIEASTGDDTTSAQKGVGYGSARNASAVGEGLSERIEGTAEQQDRELHYALKEYKRRHGEKRHRDRGRSRSPRRERRHRHRDIQDKHRSHRNRSGSHSRDRRRRNRSRSHDRSDPQRRNRSRSPNQRRHKHAHERRP